MSAFHPGITYPGLWPVSTILQRLEEQAASTKTVVTRYSRMEPLELDDTGLPTAAWVPVAAGARLRAALTRYTANEYARQMTYENTVTVELQQSDSGWYVRDLRLVRMQRGFTATRVEALDALLRKSGTRDYQPGLWLGRLSERWLYLYVTLTPSPGYFETHGLARYTPAAVVRFDLRGRVLAQVSPAWLDARGGYFYVDDALERSLHATHEDAVLALLSREPWTDGQLAATYVPVSSLRGMMERLGVWESWLRVAPFRVDDAARPGALALELATYAQCFVDAPEKAVALERLAFRALTAQLDIEVAKVEEA